MQETKRFHCDHCKRDSDIGSNASPRFCPICGFEKIKVEPNENIIRNRYRIITSIGKGGMGEVLLAYDQACERNIALKRIRPDLLEHSQVRNRFLKEARITCQLIHPAIIPIYTIHKEEKSVYYTMPYVEGETLKQIIRKARHQEKKEKPQDHATGSIPYLMRIFITICQAIAYAHSKGVIHRDLKLENIIVGKYGEVLILDWGLAKYIYSPEDIENIPADIVTPMTKIGKIVGTIAYMAPERALGHPATFQTDIYSLGVILYQILSLRPPFKRGKTFTEFKKNIKREKWVDPVLFAPYRDIPRSLVRVAQKCLSPDISSRYQTMNELINDLENYVEGRSEWFLMSQLKIDQKSDWEFQENVLIAEHTAITRTAEEAEWVSMMVSKNSFSGNIKIETEVCLFENGNGIGFLFNVPEIGERAQLNSGYCLWLGSDINRSTKLLRSNVEVFYAPDIFLKRNEWHRIRIEKIEETIHVYVNDALQLSYIAHLPLIGTHVGILSRDADFNMSSLKVYVGSLNITVSCLSVPDAFLAHGDFYKALREYRRIAASFPDRKEGREAIFRGGLTIIEQAKAANAKEELLDLAIKEFEKLHKTPGAPLEYLGKALVYQALKEEEEEIKCFELAYRRYPSHPLLALLQEHIILRMHEVSRSSRTAAYKFILLAIRHLPLTDIDTHSRRLFTSLQKHWEPLPFIQEPTIKNRNLHFSIKLAFWLAEPFTLEEIIKENLLEPELNCIEIGNALFSLIELGAWQFASKIIERFPPHEELDLIVNLLLPAIECHHSFEKSLDDLINQYEEFLNNRAWRSLWHILNTAADRKDSQLIHKTIIKLNRNSFSFEQKLFIDCIEIVAYLIEKNWPAAQKVFKNYSPDMINKESSPLYFLYGCLLQGSQENKLADIYFSDLLNIPYPRTWTLGSQFLAGNISLNDQWFKKAFFWEKRQLFRRLTLFYYCANNLEKQEYYQNLEREYYIHVET